MRTNFQTVLCVAFLLLSTSAQAQDTTADPDEPLSYTRIFADSSGASHFADDEMALALVDPGRAIQPTPASSPIPATGLMFFCPPPEAFVDWHPTPRRQFNLILSGEVEVEVSNGEIRRFVPGNVLLVEDVEGQGHRTRVVGGERACFAAVPLAEQ